jgi:hypothetical protein
MERAVQLMAIFREDLIPSQFLISLMASTAEFVMDATADQLITVAAN